MADVLTEPIALDRDSFMRRLIASLGHLNEGILGSDIAGGYIINVGLSMGAAIEAEYKRFWGLERPFTVDEYAHVIVDLKQKIQGNFSLVSKDAERVVVRTTSCPFDDFVRQSPSLCFMTSSVFGGIAARNFGYAKVVLHKRIALGDEGCYVTVYLKPTEEAQRAVGREYFPDLDRASPDIAEQLRLMDSVRRLRQALGETNSRWEEIVRGAAEAVCLLAPDGTVTFANARWRDLLGVEGGEMVGANLQLVVHPEEQPDQAKDLARALGGERIGGRLWRLRHRDGRWRDTLASAAPVRDEQGQIVGVLGIFRDVTEQRETERLKSELLSTASHELRTPIGTIKATAQLLLRSIESRGSVESRQLIRRLTTIQREADRLALLSADLLDIARLQAGKLEVRTEPENLSVIVEASVARQRDLLGGTHRHQILLNQPPGPIMVSVERIRIQQVIENLLDNAVKYSPDGGEIGVTVEERDGWACVLVTDHGIGIPEGDLSRVFTPFFRGTNVSSRTFMGLGLGLHLCKMLVEVHGGDLTVNSVEGEGTTMTVLLPLLGSATGEQGPQSA